MMKAVRSIVIGVVVVIIVAYGLTNMAWYTEQREIPVPEGTERSDIGYGLGGVLNESRVVFNKTRLSEDSRVHEYNDFMGLNESATGKVAGIMRALMATSLFLAVAFTALSYIVSTERARRVISTAIGATERSALKEERERTHAGASRWFWLLVFASGVLLLVMMGTMYYTDFFAGKYYELRGLAVCGAPLIILGVLQIIVGMGVRRLDVDWRRRVVSVTVVGLAYISVLLLLLLGTISSASIDHQADIDWGTMLPVLVPALALLVLGIVIIVMDFFIGRGWKLGKGDVLTYLPFILGQMAVVILIIAPIWYTYYFVEAVESDIPGPSQAEGGTTSLWMLVAGVLMQVASLMALSRTNLIYIDPLPGREPREA